MNAMMVNAKQIAMMRPTNTISPAWCCSGVLFTTGFCKALIFDVSFANCATTTTPNHDRYKYRVADEITPFHEGFGNSTDIVSVPVDVMP